MFIQLYDKLLVPFGAPTMYLIKNLLGISMPN